MKKNGAHARILFRARTPREVGLIIRERRKELGLDQATLGRKVGVSRQWVIAIERGKSGAEIGLVMRTLNALNLVLEVSSTAGAGNGDKSARRKSSLGSQQPDIDISAIVDRARERR